MGIAIDKISDFLHGPYCEGPQQLRGYIPCNLRSGGTANYYGGPDPDNYEPMGISGVTIATGVDLGQTSASVLENLGLAMAVVNQLVPYLGRRQRAAVDVLHRLPLTVSRYVADSLDHAMLRHHASLISARYDRDAGPDAFAALPWQAQAAVFSILYQRGCGSPKKFQKTWAALVRQDWAEASARLQNSSLWSGYHKRRAREGKLLEDLI